MMQTHNKQKWIVLLQKRENVFCKVLMEIFFSQLFKIL